MAQPAEFCLSALRTLPACRYPTSVTEYYQKILRIKFRSFLDHRNGIDLNLHFVTP
jgi:hypothetical protein